MPSVTEKTSCETSHDLLNQFRINYGYYPGFRPTHARGILLQGAFTPTPLASRLTKAGHFHPAALTFITARLSNSTGNPCIPDNNWGANPRGLAIRFHLSHDEHTDIIAHSTPGFPVRTAEDFLEMLRVIMVGEKESLRFLEHHPKAEDFLKRSKRVAASFATQTYYGVSALQFVTSEGKRTAFRWQLIPVAKEEFVDTDALQEKDAGFLLQDVSNRLARGEPIEFRLCAQLAGKEDVTDDATVQWPSDRMVVDLGAVKLEKGLEGDELEEWNKVAFDPSPSCEGIETTQDPLWEVRKKVYKMSGKQRRNFLDESLKLSQRNRVQKEDEVVNGNEERGKQRTLEDESDSKVSGSETNRYATAFHREDPSISQGDREKCPSNSEGDRQKCPSISDRVQERRQSILDGSGEKRPKDRRMHIGTIINDSKDEAVGLKRDERQARGRKRNQHGATNEAEYLALWEQIGQTKAMEQKRKRDDEDASDWEATRKRRRRGIRSIKRRKSGEVCAPKQLVSTPAPH